jgi:hypothetical protein
VVFLSFSFKCRNDITNKVTTVPLHTVSSLLPLVTLVSTLYCLSYRKHLATGVDSVCFYCILSISRRNIIIKLMCKHTLDLRQSPHIDTLFFVTFPLSKFISCNQQPLYNCCRLGCDIVQPGSWVLTSSRNVCLHLQAAWWTMYTGTHLYWTTPCHKLEDNNLNSRDLENLKCNRRLYDFILLLAETVASEYITFPEPSH